MKTGQNIYDLAVILMDGDEFSDETAVETLLQVIDSKIRAERDWNILKKTATLPAGTFATTSITDLDKILAVRSKYGSASTDVTPPLKKANFDDRFNLEKDYWINPVGNSINLIGDNNGYAQYPLVVDYKYTPATLDLDEDIVFPDFMAAIYAYELVMNYKELDENSDFYQVHGVKYEKLLNQAIDWNETLYAE